MRKEKIEDIKNKIVGKYKEILEALILVGSFSRGEEITRMKDGREIFVSDLEFLAVLKPNAIGESLSFKDESIDVSIGKTTREHLKRLKPYIFTVEVKKYGKVIWGDASVLELIPDFTEKDIDPLDSFILLNNRMVEQLKLRQRIEKGEEIDAYGLKKGFIQLVNSILAFHGQYHCKYPDKLNAFLRMNWDEDFKAQVQEAFDLAASSTSQECHSEDARKQWLQLRTSFNKVYTLHRKYVQEGLASQIKGWVKLFVQSKAHYFSFFEILGNVFIRSPQFLIYHQAAEIYFAKEWQPEQADRLVQCWEDIVK